jgi:hypothetical protein
MYSAYWIPHLAERTMRPSVVVDIFESAWFVLAVCHYLILCAQVCVGLLMDKRHHARITGRKLFEKGPASAT